MPYDVIVERPAMPPQLVYTTTSHERAKELAGRIMYSEGQASGVKVHVRTADSADQLQVSRSGVALRDQPELDAVGEALTIHVPTIEVKVTSK